MSDGMSPATFVEGPGRTPTRSVILRAGGDGDHLGIVRAAVHPQCVLERPVRHPVVLHHHRLRTDPAHEPLAALADQPASPQAFIAGWTAFVVGDLDHRHPGADGLGHAVHRSDGGHGGGTGAGKDGRRRVGPQISVEEDLRSFIAIGVYAIIGIILVINLLWPAVLLIFLNTPGMRQDMDTWEAGGAEVYGHDA